MSGRSIVRQCTSKAVYQHRSVPPRVVFDSGPILTTWIARRYLDQSNISTKLETTSKPSTVEISCDQLFLRVDLLQRCVCI